jgi:hypothetical protein
MLMLSPANYPSSLKREVGYMFNNTFPSQYSVHVIKNKKTKTKKLSPADGGRGDKQQREPPPNGQEGSGVRPDPHRDSVMEHAVPAVGVARQQA